MTNCFSKRSAVILPLLFAAILIFSSCSRETGGREYTFESLPYEPEIVLNDVRSYMEAENIQIVFYDTEVVIEDDVEAEKLINGLFSEWKGKVPEAALGTAREFRSDYLGNVEIVSMEAENEVTYLEGGLISVCCRLKYSYFGNDYFVYVGGEVIDLQNKTLLSYADILKTDSVTVENILTGGFSGQFTKDYREEIKNLGGEFADRCGIIIEDGKLVFYLRAEEMPIEERIFTTGISFSGNENIFVYDISE